MCKVIFFLRNLKTFKKQVLKMPGRASSFAKLLPVHLFPLLFRTCQPRGWDMGLLTRDRDSGTWCVLGGPGAPQGTC